MAAVITPTLIAAAAVAKEVCMRAPDRLRLDIVSEPASCAALVLPLRAVVFDRDGLDALVPAPRLTAVR
jgi:hypothetical protein